MTIPDPPDQTGTPFVPGGKGRSAPDGTYEPSGAGSTCWLCGRPIHDPPEIIGQYIAGHQKVAHRHCWQTLGEHELELHPDPAA